MYSYNDWLRLLVLLVGMMLGWYMVYKAKKQWQEVLGIATILCSFLIPVLIEARFWWIRTHTMYDGDWKIIQDLIGYHASEAILLFGAYVVLGLLWIACISQIITRLISRKKKL